MSNHQPPQDGLTRRRASQLIASATLLSVAGLAAAQPVPKKDQKPSTPPRRNNNPAQPVTDPSQPPKPEQPKSFLDAALTKGRSRDWVLKPVIHIQSYQEDPGRVPRDGSRSINIIPLDFKSAAVIFPVIHGCASSKTDEVDNLKSELTFDDRPVDIKPDFNESYHASVRLGRWEMTDLRGREAELKLEIPMTCWQTVLDEKVAAKAEWPKGGWGRIAQSTLAPQARVDLPGSDPDDGQALRDLVKRWLNDQPPQSMPPLLLAKTLAARTVEQFQKSGNGELFTRLGTFSGLDLQGPAITIQRGTGSPHDIASVLLGAYRAAGLPSRLVIGYDQSDRKGDNSTPFSKASRSGTEIRSWVEFCLYDAAAKKECWVPVDVVKIRSRSSRPGRIEDPWKYFGTHDELDVVLPFAHHFIPPTTVVAYGYAFWGWLTMPQTQVAENWVRFTAQTAAKRAEPRTPNKAPVKPS